MPNDRPPLLEGSRLAWILTALVAATLVGFVLAERLRPWIAALLHVALLSVIAYALFAWDKRRARKQGRRISEANLLWLIVLGGAVGAWLGMRQFRHKTQHRLFRFGVPVVLLAHVAAVAWLAAQA